MNEIFKVGVRVGHSSIHSFSIRLVRTYYITGTILSPRKSSANKTVRIPAFMKLTLSEKSIGKIRQENNGKKAVPVEDRNNDIQDSIC